MSAWRKAALDWLDQRTGIREIVRSQLTGYLLPATTNRWYSLGFVLLVFVALQIVTGVLLLIYYVPSSMHAFDSVQRIVHDIPFGWLIRGLHVHGANAMVIVLLVHMLSVLVMGAYKSPRELQWVTGYLLLFTTLGLCFTGYVLPWSQLSFWATTVGMNLMGSVPLVGPTLQEYFQGGQVVGPTTLGRAAAFHVTLLPMMLIALIGLHLFLVRTVGISAAPRLDDAPVPHDRPFFPDFVLEDAAVAFAILTIFAGVLFFLPNLYLPPDAFVKADPFVTPAHVKPEWYFLASYEVLRLVPSKTVGILIQMSAALGLLLLPFLDRGRRRHILHRPIFLTALSLSGIGLIVLTILGARA